VAISSSNGLKAVELAVRRMQEGVDPLDAAIAGVNLVEDDPADMTVGTAAFPTRKSGPARRLRHARSHGPRRGGGALEG